MSKLPLLAFLLIGASVSVMLFLSKTPFDSFRPLILQTWDQSWNEAKKFIFHPDCRCHRLIPEQLASCYSWKPHFRRIPPHWTRRTEVSMNTPVGSNVGVRTILILLPRILIFWKGFLVQLPDNRSWLGSKGGHCVVRFPDPLVWGTCVGNLTRLGIVGNCINGQRVTSWRLDTKQRRHLLPTWPWQCVAMRKNHRLTINSSVDYWQLIIMHTLNFQQRALKSRHWNLSFLFPFRFLASPSTHPTGQILT